MAELHEALSCLGPVAWDDVPVSSAEQLREYAQEIFSKSKLIIETVPEQISSDYNDDNSNGNNADEPMLLPGAGPSASQYESLRKEWGKPLKMNNAKDNPLNIPMYKLSGKDGKGAWFARRSVHKGLPFARWKAKMQIEIEETLKGREEEKRQGRTPESSVRGIGADAKLENVGIVNDGGSQNLGSIDVYKLSAQFPGPTTARDFVTMIMTTDSLPGEEGEEIEKDDHSFLVVSKPCIHPEVPPQNDYIRGQYESVEIIRELPVKPSQKENEANGATTGLESPASGSSRSTGSGSSTNHPNPVEWIMVTRSDPGGSVPRWMVERGTPKSITGDTVKFLNWASQPDVSDKQDTADIGEMTKDAETQQPIDSEQANGRLSGIEGKSVADQQRDAIGTGNEGAKQLNQAVTDSRDTGLVNNQASNGLWNSVTSMLNNGLETYAPQAVFNYMPTHDDGNNTVPIQGEEEDDDSSVVSDDSFTSAESKIPASILDQPVKEQSGSTNGSSLALNEEIAEITAKKDPQVKPSSKEKELAKLQTRKREVETQITTIQSEIEALGGTSIKDTGTSDNESGRTSASTSSATVAALYKTSVNPQEAVRDQKRIADLSRTEAKLNSQLRKIEAQQLKLVKKIEAHQTKATEREEKSRSKSEAESLRKEVQSLKEEVRELRGEREKWLDIIGRLQKENVKLAEKNNQTNKGE